MCHCCRCTFCFNRLFFKKFPFCAFRVIPLVCIMCCVLIWAPLKSFIFEENMLSLIINICMCSTINATCSFPSSHIVLKDNIYWVLCDSSITTYCILIWYCMHEFLIVIRIHPALSCCGVKVHIVTHCNFYTSCLFFF